MRLFLLSACLLLFTHCGRYHLRLEPAVPPKVRAPAAPAPAPSPAAVDTVRETAPLQAIRVERNSVRVFLEKGSAPLRLALTDPFTVYAGGQSVGTLTGKVPASMDSRALRIDGRSVPLPVSLVPQAAASLFELNGRTYRGSLVFRCDSSGKPVVINEVAVEEYLKGVVPYEIGKREAVHFEALKVQAVAARTYTYARLNIHAADGFDVYPDETDQVYQGTGSRYALADSAVDATRDEVITHSDTLIRAYYFSTSPGKTSNIEEVWPDKGYRPYLRSVNDSSFSAAARYFTWREEWRGPELERIVNRFMPETFPDFSPGPLQNIAVTARAACGRAMTTLFVVGGREYRVAGDRVRWILRRPIKDNPILRSAFFNLEIDQDSAGRISRVAAAGGGYGHGVGLSQIGALSMAEKGMKAEEIIKLYYTGVELKKVAY